MQPPQGVDGAPDAPPRMQRPSGPSLESRKSVDMGKWNRQIKAGWLMKEGNASSRFGIYKNWKRRWFILRPNGITYWAKPEDAFGKEYDDALGFIPLRNHNVVGGDEVVEEKSKRRYSFLLCPTDPNGRTYYLAADNEAEMREWASAIREARDEFERFLAEKQERQSATLNAPIFNARERSQSMNLTELARSSGSSAQRVTLASIAEGELQGSAVQRGECLIEAVEEGNADEVHRLLREARLDDDPNALDATVNYRGFHRRTPVIAAAQMGHARIVDLLCSYDADVNASSLNGTTALHYAAANGHTAIVERLVFLGAKTAAVTEQGATPLHVAVQQNKFEAAHRLVALGAPIDVKDESGVTPIDAIKDDVVAEKLRSVSDSREAESPEFVDAVLSAALGKIERVQEIISRGSFDINETGMLGRTPLHAAAMGGHDDTCRYLVQNGANVNIETTSGYTALHYATEHGHASVLRLLIAMGANVGLRNRRGETPLDLARARAATDEALVPLVDILEKAQTAQQP